MNKKIFIVMLAAVIFISSTGGFISSQTPVVLLRGPHEVRGIEFLNPNMIYAYTGEYIYEDYLLKVIFTREDIFLADNLMIKTNCYGKRVIKLKIELDDPQTDLYFYKSDFGFSLFFMIPREFEKWCGFTREFIDRFIYFFEFKDNDVDVPFPAILDLSN